MLLGGFARIHERDVVLRIDVVMVDPAEGDSDVGYVPAASGWVGIEGSHLGGVSGDMDSSNLVIVKDLGVRGPGGKVGVRDRGKGELGGGAFKELVVAVGAVNVGESAREGLGLDGGSRGVELDVLVRDRGGGGGDDTLPDREGGFVSDQLCDGAVDGDSEFVCGSGGVSDHVEGNYRDDWMGGDGNGKDGNGVNMMRIVPLKMNVNKSQTEREQ